ncbi:MAG: ComF family protein [Alphaproteobacteria bacterium]|nr:ComF family protein [Alphaproteobacteria bacterium]
MLNALKHNRATQLARTALDVLLPPRCPGSGLLVAQHGTLDAAFWRELQFITNPMCQACGLPFDFDAGPDTLCAVCLETPPDFHVARAAVVYNDASRKLVLDLKYNDRLHIVHNFVPWLQRAGAGLIEGSDVIVPVPLHPKRLWKRRYNQSALISGALALKCTKKHIPDALLRIRHTPQQKGLSRTERAENMRGAFAVNPLHDFAGKNVLLVDDVYTSGATINACAKALLKGGATHVRVLTVGRVLRE